MRKRILSLVAAFVIAFSFAISNIELTNAETVNKTSTTTTQTEKKTTKKKNKYYVSGAKKLPYSQKFEFKKSMVRRTFAGTSDGKIKINFERTRITSDDTATVQVKIYYRSTGKKKWICPSGCTKSVKFDGKSNNYDLEFQIPKDRPFYVKLVKKSLPDVAVKGRLNIKH